MSFMSDAIACAKMSKDVPIGAVIVFKNKVIASSVNGKAPFEHAEFLAINHAYETIGGDIRDADIYVTLEPCVMCCGLIALAKIKRVYFGAYDDKYGATQHAFAWTTHKPEVYGGIQESECKAILQAFFSTKRHLCGGAVGKETTDLGIP